MSSGPPYPALIDTDVLRAFRGGDLNAMRFISATGNLGRHHISRLSAMVLVADAPDPAERAGLVMFFSWCVIHPLNAPTSRRAFRILEQLPPPAALTADDAIIAATAIEHNLPLYTLDVARYAGVPGLTALRPY